MERPIQVVYMAFNSREDNIRREREHDLNLIQGIEMLEQAGFISAERKAEIMS